MMDSTAGTDLNSIIDQAATQYGIDPSLLLTTARIESHFNPHAANASGHVGLFQFSPSTAKQYGVTNRFDPAQSADGAARYYLALKSSLAKSLGRTPTNGELYLAYQQGPGGAAALLKNPNVSAVDALAPAYGGDRRKAAAAIVENGGTPSMTAGQFASQWAGKFGEHQAAQAQSAPINIQPQAQKAAAKPTNTAPGIKGQFANALLNNLSQIGHNAPSVPTAPLTSTPAQAPQMPQTPGIGAPQMIPLIG